MPEEVITTAPVNHAVADEQGLRTDIPGQNTTVSELSAAELSPNDLFAKEIEQQIIDFEPNNFALGTIAAKATQKRYSGSMEVQHYAIGSNRIRGTVTTAYTPGDTPSHTAVLAMDLNDSPLFQRDMLACAVGIPGYAPDGTTPTPDEELLFQVVGRDGQSNPIFYAINGKKVSPNDDETYVPAIPAGTVLITLSSAASESQLFTAPMSHIPSPETRYMQRQLLNVQMSEYFKNAKKQVAWGKADVIEKAVREFRRLVELNYLLGVQSKRMTQDSSRVYSGQEYVYTSRGILRQLPRKFEYAEGQFTYNNLLQLSKELFADNNGGKRAVLFAGEDLIQSILSIDYSIYKDLSIGSKTHWGIDMTDYSSPFGTISLLHYPMLDQIGRSAQGFAIDPTRFYRYIFKEPYRESINMRVHGEEAERDVYVQTDCLVLKGDNHALIKPAV